MGKINILRLSQNPRFLLTSVLSAPSEANLNALAWKMALGVTKMQKKPQLPGQYAHI